jgi:DNA polymerase phi
MVALVIDASKSQKSMTGLEERDVLFARLFGLTAVIQSGLLVRTKPLPSSAALPSTLLSYQETIIQLLSLGEKKSWLRESACWAVGLAIDALGESNVSWKKDAVDATIQSIFVQNKSWSPEKVAMTIKLQNWYPEREWRKILSPSFNDPDLLSTRNLQTIAGLLKVIQCLPITRTNALKAFL